MRQKVFAALLTLALLFGMAAPAAAHKMVPVVPPTPGGPPPLALDSLQVDVAVADGVARVRLDQVFVNRSAGPAEGTYVFPLPPGAAVSSFAMFVDGEAYQAEVLDAQKARDVYESIVRRNRDPALLQYIGQGLLQARVFPVPPGAERRIRVEYEQVLPRDGGLWELAVPLSDDPVPRAAITVTMKDQGAGGTIYSPTHAVGISRRPDGTAVASYEGTAVAGTFRLFFGREDQALGVNLLTYKTGSEDGYFLLLVNPPGRSQAEVVAKDVILAIDLSGSMSGEKFEQAKGAAQQILGALGADDRFAVIGFHADTVTYADELRSAREAGDAMKYVRNLRLGGATNIDEAMARAQAIAGSGTGRPQVIILLTDGQPTAGETDPERIQANVKARATGSQRIFTFGVGFDVNTVLLDAMAQENRGRSDYVKPGENLEAAVAAFWNKVGQPVLSDVTLEWSGVKVEEVYPRPLPDLYLGSQMVVLGRYRDGAEASLTVRGKVNGETRTYSFKNLRFAERDAGRDYIPRLWANRKVGWLLGEVRRQAPNPPDKELIDEIVALSQRFGIATPYTSFFVNEPNAPVPVPAVGGPPTTAPGAEFKAPAMDAGQVAQKVAAAPASGEAAVSAAQQVGAIREASALSQTQPAGEAGGSIRTAGDKTFVLRQGVWVDTAYQSGDLTYLTTGSDRYLDLVRLRPDLARYLAVGTPLVLADGSTAYGIDIPGKAESAVDMKATAGAPPAAGAQGGPPARTGALWMLAALPLLAAGGALTLWARRRRSA